MVPVIGYHAADWKQLPSEGDVQDAQPAGPVRMGRSLASWFLYSVVVSVFAGYALALLTAGTSGWLWPA